MSEEKESASVSRSTPPSPPLVSIPREAPPAYETLASFIHPTVNRQNSIRLPDDPVSITSSTPNHHATHAPLSFRSPPTNSPPSRVHTRSLSSSSVPSVSSLKGKKSWFGFSSSTTPAQTTRKPNSEIRTTVLNLVRDLVQEHSSGSPAALGILQSCSEACTAHGVSLSTILQDKFIESHSPLYWAIVKRRQPDSSEDADTRQDHQPMELLDALLKQASPLNSDTVAELRQACLATSDHSIFQRLRIIPQFSATTGADKVILGSTLPPDDVSVELGPGNEGAFAVNFDLYQFHKRMMVAKEIKEEFVVRNRIWKISFLITPDNVWYGPPPGSWSISLSLQEPSPPTWFDGRLVLPDSDKPLRLRSKQMMEGPRNDIPATQVVVAMEDSSDFSSLQYSGSTFIPADERLRVRLEAKLRKPDPTSDTCVMM
ncbi:hypothetical protein CPB83DRAFT_838741 [Crepidotus variabilis]|uniref:Uncharacterized protein n=1 Tax=Crepidotus variabilis TaxID=179855 RepID=A0A9P6JLD1_9AGAR|nr:hypothetical protein CPB83DRAFT_838741 [Crepidotus variabilis]